ncbi:MAG: putative phospholipase c precursor protein [Caulobacteraceae bacterium]|nr:putative phospholipase c precursor protein [Caulobacteraceae bacterium]
MTSTPRREFLTLVAGSAVAAGASWPAIAKALAVPPNRTTRSIKDVEHVVILMQENRAFDHYFGTLRGVRGFGDPRPVTLPSGRPVWFQPDPQNPGGHVLPFRLDGAATSAQVMGSLDHSWKGSHERWKRHDAWVEAKSRLTMGYFTRADLPFYYALADAFTVCDAYYCSIFGPTNPNRMFLFTGTNGLTVGESGPNAVDNPPEEPNQTADMAHDSPAYAGFGWTSYAERLQAAGVSWKVYQEYDNYSDNPLAFCRAFRGVSRDSPLYQRGRDWVAGSTPENAKSSRGEHLVAAFRRDIAAGTLPQVSWMVAPYIMCEHPSASPGYGQSLTARLLQALADHPETWARTVFLLTYDENDGFFDHAPPPLPAVNSAMGASTVDVAGEIYQGEPVGLGPRVPMLAISPWSRGGWVDSEVFDHTSIIRFLERRFGVAEPNISAWRRAVCGDLTSVFDFEGRAGRTMRARLPEASSVMAKVDSAASLPAPRAPDRQALPTQEPGGRPARPLHYRLDAHASVTAGRVRLTFVNDGVGGAAVSVWPLGAEAGPWFYTIGAGARLVADHPIGPDGYDLSVHGPNGFFRRFVGSSAGGPEVEVTYVPERDELALTLTSAGADRRLTVTPGVYPHGQARSHAVETDRAVVDVWKIGGTAHWYDLIVTSEADPRWRRRLSGHMETGRPSFSDPAIA